MNKFDGFIPKKKCLYSIKYAVTTTGVKKTVPDDQSTTELLGRPNSTTNADRSHRPLIELPFIYKFQWQTDLGSLSRTNNSMFSFKFVSDVKRQCCYSIQCTVWLQKYRSPNFLFDNSIFLNYHKRGKTLRIFVFRTGAAQLSFKTLIL